MTVMKASLYSHHCTPALSVVFVSWKTWFWTLSLADNVSWSDSRFYTGSRRAGDAFVPSLRRHVARQIKEFRETSPVNDASVDMCWNSGGAGGGRCRRRRQRSKLRERMVQDVATLTRGVGGNRKKGRLRRRGPATSKMTSFWAATLGASGGGAAGLMDSGGHCVALPCASAKCRSRELNETVFAMNFLETGGICRSESCEKWSTPSCPQNLVPPALHSVISDFRPPRGTESGEAALWRLLACHALGG